MRNPRLATCALAFLVLAVASTASAQKAPGSPAPEPRTSPAGQASLEQAVQAYVQGMDDFNAGRFSEAVPRLDHAARHLTEALGVRDPGVLRILLDYARALEAVHRYADASMMTRQVFEHARAAQQLDLYIAAAETEARLAGHLGDYENALELYEILLEDAERRHGARSRNALSHRIQVAVIYNAQQRVGEAEALARALLDEAEALQPPDFHITYRARWVLAEALRETHRLDEMVALYTRNLQEAERESAPDSAFTIATLLDLAMGLVYRGEFEQARALAERAYRVYEARGETGSQAAARALNVMAMAEAELGDDGLARAESLTRRVLATLTATSGLRSHDTLQVRYNLATIIDQQNRPEEALALHRENLGLYEDLLGPHHPHTALSRNRVAEAGARLGDAATALPAFRQAIADYDATLGPDHVYPVRARARLAQLLLDGHGPGPDALQLAREAARPVRARLISGQSDLSRDITAEILTTHVDAAWSAAHQEG